MDAKALSVPGRVRGGLLAALVGAVVLLSGCVDDLGGPLLVSANDGGGGGGDTG